MQRIASSHLHLSSVLQDLKLYETCIDVGRPTIELLKLFEADATLPGVILQNEADFVGMVSRQQFFERMSRPYSRDLFNRRPIRILYEYVNNTLMILPGDTPIQLAARLSLERSPKLIYEPLVVQAASSHYRLLDIQQLLLAQSKIHELTMLALQESQQALITEKELAQITLHSIGDGVITTDAVGRVRSLNPVAERLTGWSFDQAETLPISQVFHIIHETERNILPNPVEAAIQHTKSNFVTDHATLIAKQGTEFAINYSTAPIASPNGLVFGAVLVFRDVSQERHLARELAWQASHDPLTQLVNRYQFDHCLQHALQQAKALNQVHVLCCLDLDHFKTVNDTCGHAAGDELLRQISRLIQQVVRQSDVVARLGGDEFAVLLSHCPLEKGCAIAQQIQQQIQAFCFAWQDHSFSIGVSIGVAQIDADSPSTTVALNEADAACYQAKHQGRNQVWAYAQMGSI